MSVSKGKQLVICESYHLVDAYSELDVGEIRLMQLCLGAIYQKEEISPKKYYPVPLDEYVRLFGVSSHGAYQAMVEAAKSLMTKTLTFKKSFLNPVKDEPGKVIIHWINSAYYNPEENRVELQWSSHIIPFICQLEGHYSKYNLDYTKKLTSANTIWLYRLLNKWKQARKLTVTVVELKRLLSLPEDSYKVFNNFKEKVIENSLKDIRLLTDLNVKVKYLPEKPGVKKTHVVFTIGKKGEKE